jgi:hypothetical protein
LRHLAQRTVCIQLPHRHAFGRLLLNTLPPIEHPINKCTLSARFITALLLRPPPSAGHLALPASTCVNQVHAPVLAAAVVVLQITGRSLVDTFLPRCIDAKPSPTSPAHLHRLSSMHRLCHIVPRVVLCSVGAWAESCRGHLIHHFRIVHLVCRSACSRPPRVSPRSSHPSTRAPSRSPHRYHLHSLLKDRLARVAPPP